MKTISWMRNHMSALVCLSTLFTVSSYAETEVFVETIVELSARDAVTLEDGSLFASNYNNGRVYKVELDGTVTTLIGSNNRGPAGIRFDDDGNMYVAMYNIGSVIKVDTQGVETVFADNINEPIALDWDSSDNLYVSSWNGPTTITRVLPDGTQQQVAKIQQLTNVTSLVLDSADDIYVSSIQTGDIYRVTQSGQVSLFASTSVPGITFLQFDETNDIFYAAGLNNNSLLRIGMDGSSEIFVESPNGGLQDGPLDVALIDSAIGLAVSDDGKQVYFATNTHLRRLTIVDPDVEQVRPYFTSDDSASIDGGSELSHRFVFEDPNSDPLTLSVENLADWMTFDGVDTVTGTASSDSSNSTVSLVATLTDGFDTVQQEFELTITAASTPTPPAPTPAQPVVQPSPSGSSGGTVDGWWLILLASVFVRGVSRYKNG